MKCSAGADSISFPISFADTNYRIVVAEARTVEFANGVPVLANKTTTSAKVYGFYGSYGDADWIAVGRS